MVMIDENSKVPLYTQLYEQIKTDILSGAIKAGTKLKSSRAVSAEMHISRIRLNWHTASYLLRDL